LQHKRKQLKRLLERQQKPRKRLKRQEKQQRKELKKLKLPKKRPNARHGLKLKRLKHQSLTLTS